MAFTIAKSNAGPHFTAALPPLFTMPEFYQTRAEVLLTSLAVSLQVPRKATFKSHSEEVIAIVRNPCVDVESGYESSKKA